MRLNVFARLPTSSLPVLTAVRCLSSPCASTDASRPSCRRGRTMRAESIQAIINAQVKAMALNSALQRNCGTTAASTVSLGTPTETSQGARWAVEEPVMRSTPSGHVSNSLPSLLTRWLAMRSKFARADPMRTVEVLRDDDSALVDDPDDAAGRKPAY